MSIDPVTFMDTGSPSYFNRYRYCANDPVNCSDPTGMSDWIPNIFTDMFSDQISSTVNEFVGEGQQSVPGGGVTLDTNDAFMGDKIVAASGPIMADAALEGVAQSSTMAIGGSGTKSASAAVSKVLPKVGSAGGPGAGKAFSEATKNAARAASGDKCVFCGTKTVRSPSPQPNRSNIDHAIPKSRGGNNTSGNAQNTCQSCNLEKSAKTTEEFMDKTQ